MICVQGQASQTFQQFKNLAGLQWIYFNMELVENEDEFTKPYAVNSASKPAAVTN